MESVLRKPDDGADAFFLPFACRAARPRPVEPMGVKTRGKSACDKGRRPRSMPEILKVDAIAPPPPPPPPHRLDLLFAGLVLACVILCPVAAQAQTTIWSVTMTAESSSGSGAAGYCDGLSLGPGGGTTMDGCGYGSLSDGDANTTDDDEFDLDGTTYTVKSVRSGNKLHLTLDRSLPPAQLSKLTLHVGTYVLPLSDAQVGKVDGGTVPNNYLWTRSSHYPLNSGATAVKILFFDPDNAPVLVSNLDQEDGSTGNLQSHDYAQAFTTGSNSGGYTLSSVDVPFHALTDSTAFSKMTAVVHANTEGAPSSVIVGTLTNPTYRVASTPVYRFAAPGQGYGLAKDRTYWIVLDVTAAVSGNNSIRSTASDAEDTDSASGWSIANNGHSRARTSSGAWTSSGHSTKIRINGVAKRATNAAPEFPNATETRSIAENTAADANIGAVIPVATDDDGDSLTYRMGGTDAASFTFDAMTRQIKTQAALDHEAKASHTVTVEVDDKTGSDTVTVTISVTDVNEPPAAPAAPKVVVASDSTTSLDVTWIEPVDTSKPAVTGYDVQYRAGNNPFTAWAHTGAGTSTTITALAAVTTYQVRVLARNAEGESPWSDTGSGTTGTNAAPEFPNATETRSIAENSAVGTNIGAVIPVATDDDGDSLTYSMGGTDAASFTFDDMARQIKTKAALDFEDKSSYTVTVTADDGNGGTDSVTVTISVTDVNEPPSEPAAPTVTRTSGSTTSLDVEWDAPVAEDNTGKPAVTGYKLEYRTGSAAFTAWTHTGTGTSATITGLTAGTTYDVRVLATNAEGDSPWSATGSGTTGANAAPEFAATTPLTRSIAENSAVGTNIGAVIPEATDADSDDLTYSMGGTDVASFTFDDMARQIKTKAALDHEAKASHTVTVEADDGTDSGTVTVIISVTDVNESPAAPAAPKVTATSGSTTSLDVTWIEPVDTSKPAITSYDLQYRAGGRGDFASGPQGVTGISTTITGLTPGTAYQVHVRATNAEGTSDWSTGGGGVTGANTAPVFAATTPLTRSIAENSAVGTNIGAVIPEATDADSHPLTYSMGGTDVASFTFDATARQIKTQAALDFEDKSSYTVTVTADDGNGGTDSVTVTISVTDVNEPPAAPAAPEVMANTALNTSLDVTWIAPSTTGKPAITDYDVQYRAGSSAAFTAWTHTGTGTSTTITGLTAGTEYQVQVLARNAEGDSPWSATGSGTTGQPVLISNLGQENGGNGNLQNQDHAQAFSTGSNSGGYTLSSVDVQFLTLSDSAIFSNMTVTIQSDSSGAPGTVLGTLTKPSQPKMGQIVYNFAAPGQGLDLAASTTYWFVIDITAGSTGRNSLRNTASNDEDDGDASGWSIANNGHWRSFTSNSNWMSFTQSRKIRINGVAKTATNRAPVFADDALTRSIAENTAADANIGAVIPAATDADSDDLTYSMGGTDVASFTFDATARQIKTQAALDFEDKSSYTVTVTADDGNGGTDSVTVTISVTNVDELLTAPGTPTVTAVSGETTHLDVRWTAPVATDNTGKPAVTGYKLEYRTGSAAFTAWTHTGTGTSATITGLTAGTTYDVRVLATNADGDSPWSATGSGTTGTNRAPVFADDALTRSIAENTAADANIGAVIPAATDADSDDLTYSMGGTDVASFTFDATARQIKTQAALDFEDKSSYTVTVTADDGNGGTDSVTVTISVTNVDELLTAPGTPTVTAVSGETTHLDVRWTAPVATDNTGKPAVTGYKLEYRTGSAAFTAWTHTGTGTSATITGLTAGTTYDVRVLATNADGDSPWSATGSGTTGTNRAPVFADDALTRSIAENTAADANIGAVIPAATDADSDDLTYSMGGTDVASFTFDATARQIKTQAALDFEDKSSYTVTVTADDGNGGTDSVTVTISVTNVDELLTAPGTPTVTAVSGETTHLDVRWTAPVATDNTGKPAVTGYKLEYRTGSAAFTAWTHTGTGTSATITGLTAGTTYDVRVLATNADGDSPWSATGSGTTGTNRAPVFADDALTRSIAENTAADANIGAVIPAATDADSDDLTYSMGGTDVASFTFDATARQIKTQAALDFEDKSSYTVTVTADDGNGGTDSVTVTISVTNVDELLTAPGTPTVTAVSGETTHLDVRWTAPVATDNTGKPAVTGYKLEYRTGSAAFTAWTHTGTGTSATITGLTAGTTYDVRVLATNADGDSPWSATGSGTTGTNRAPVFADDALTRSIAENTAADANIGAVIPAATDADSDDLTYSMGGTDVASFTFDATARQIKTQAALDFEDKSSYTVTVTADDGNGGTDSVTVTISVTNVDELLTAPGTPTVTAVSGETTHLDVRWTAPVATDNTGKPAVTGYKLEYRTGSAAFTAWTHTGTGTSATITGLTAGTTYDVRVLATNADGDSPWSATGSGTTGTNRAPVFADDALTRSIAENTAADANIGAVIPAATDADSDDLTYSMGGTDVASFTFDATARQIKTQAALDFEDKSSYTVTVTADDGNGGTDSVTVTISVTNVDELLTAPGTPTVTAVSGETTHLDVRWTAPVATDNTGKPAVTGYKLEYRTGSAAFTAWTHTGTGTSATITGLTAGTTYDVRVLATNADGDSPWSATGSGTTGTNRAPVFADDALTRSIAENTAADANIGAVIPAATDADSDDLTYSMGGTDVASFTFDATARQIKTQAALDFEDKSSYTVTVTADDGNGGTDSVTVTISVTNVDELLTAPGTPTVTAVSGETTHLDVRWTAPVATDNTGKPAVTGYKLEYRTGSAAFTAWTHTGTGTSATITGLTAGTTYDVRVLATNADGDSPWSATGSGTTGTNRAPVFADDALTRSIAENTAADANIGAVIPAATDADSDDLTYSMGGTDVASFTFDATARQIKTQAALDFEDKSSYTVTVTADDGNGGTDSVTVTISVTNVDELLTAPGTPTVTAVSGETTHLDVRWTAPVATDNTGKPAVTGYKLEYRTGSAAFTAWTHTGTGTSATITGLTAGTTYDVRVLATNADGDSPWSAPGSGTTGSSTGTVTLSLGRTAVTEGGGAQAVAVTGRLDGLPEAADVTVTLSAGGGTAQAGDDYAAPGVTLSIPAGQTSGRATFTVTPVNDAVDEGDETLVVSGTLSSSQSLSVAPAAGLTVTITDDDTRGVRVSPTALTVREGQSGTYTVRLLSQPTGGDVTVTASAGSDLTLTPSTLTFTDSDYGAKTIMVAAEDNDRVEADVTVPVTHAVSGADYGANSVEAASVTVTVPGHEPSGRGGLQLQVPTPQSDSATVTVTVPPGTPVPAGLSLALPARTAGLPVTIDPVEPPGDDPQGFRLGDTVVDIDGVVLESGETATVCLPAPEDGEASVRRWDETEKEWVDLEEPPGGSPAGRACGVTTSFSVFAVILRLEAPGLVFSPDPLTVQVGGADGASYTVALSAAPAGEVTVTVTASAESDLTLTPSTLTFTDSDYGAKTITVTASEDAEPGEAVLVHEASGERYLEPWRAELKVTVEKDTGLRAQLREAWLARFGRTAAGHVAEAVEERLSASAAAEAGLELPGPDLQTMALSGALDMLNGGAAPDFRQMLADSSFVLPLASDGQRNWTAWGRGAYTEFDGREGGLELDGEVLTGTVGIDREQGRWRLGLALSHSDGDGEVRTADGGRYDLESTLTGLHPYARWQGRERLSAWGVLGFGEGKLETREGGEASETDTGMRMAAFGLRGALGSFESARGAFDLAVKSDVLAVRMEADEDAALPEVDADARRVRLLLEGAGHYALQSGGAVAPVLEAGVRFDDGEAETGLGAELGARLRYVGAGGRMSAELSARGLLAHEAHDYDEWGVGGSLVLHPDAVGRGLALRMASAFGPTVSEAEALWNRHDLAGLASERPDAPVGRLEAELSYGLAGPGGRGSLTPYARHERRGPDSQWRLGARLEVGDELQLHLEGVRGNENALGIHGFVHW